MGMQTNSISESSGKSALPSEEEEEAFVEEEVLDDDVEDVETPDEVVVHRERKPSEHTLEDERYGHLDGVGMIYGNVGATSFNLRVLGDLQKMDYVQVLHQSHGWVLGQVSDMERKTDLTLERAKRLSEGMDVDIDEIVIAKISILGFRDERKLLQVPRSPFRAGDMV